MASVSIIIPCHNAAPWLAATLASALAQNWKPLEVILVDDGSTDGSVEMARSFASRGVTIISQANRGASAARNRGLETARGDTIQFLDADDLLAPGKVAAQMARLQAAGAGFIASGAWARFRADPAQARFEPEPAWRDLSGLEFLILHYEAGWMMQPGAWLCPRALLDTVGPWDARLTLNDDGEYFGRVALAAKGILFCPDSRVYYRSGHSASLSRRKDVRSLQSLWLSTALTCGRLLAAAKDDPRAREAVANGWRRLAYECYPAAPDLADAAEKQFSALGGSRLPPPGTAVFQRLSRLVGWRGAKRILGFLGRC